MLDSLGACRMGSVGSRNLGSLPHPWKERTYFSSVQLADVTMLSRSEMYLELQARGAADELSRLLLPERVGSTAGSGGKGSKIIKME